MGDPSTTDLTEANTLTAISRITLTILGAIAAALLIACGGDDESSSDPASGAAW